MTQREEKGSERKETKIVIRKEGRRGEGEREREREREREKKLIDWYFIGPLIYIRLYFNNDKVKQKLS